MDTLPNAGDIPLVDNSRPPIVKGDTGNYLLQLTTDKTFAALAPHLEPFEAERGIQLFASEEPLDKVHFLDSGIGSLVAMSPEGHECEIGLFGRDGFSPSSVMLGAERSPYRCVIQVAGSGHRITASRLKEIAAENAGFQQLLLKYVDVQWIQTSFTALSNAVHHVDERLARWLLMCHDRIDGDEIALTHEFLSLMLAVRRPSVTTALHVLEGNRLIRSERGCVTIRDRAALEDFASDAYGRPEAEYEKLLKPLRRTSD
jgi:CRP-like cAMP-binding protein|tara:strand:+ start:6827 stop:7603 length:777 start_codon:yes stop_codon:yes gene_type:complete